jgi:hypothetical protein
MLMVAFLMSAAEARAAAFAQHNKPTESLLLPMHDHALGHSVGRSEDGNLAEARWGRYAFSATCACFADHVAVWLKVICEREGLRHRKAAQSHELMASGDFGHARCRRIGWSQRREYRVGLTPNRQSYCQPRLPRLLQPRPARAGQPHFQLQGLHASKSGSLHSCEEAFNARAQQV